MVSVNLGSDSIYCNNSFGQKEHQNPATPAILQRTTQTDEFIKDCKKQVEGDIKGNWISRSFGNITATLPLLMAFIYDLAHECKIIRSSKKLTKTAYKEALKQSLKKCTVVTIIGGIATYVLNKYFNSKTNENYQKLNQHFDKLNANTNAEFADNMLCSNYLGAQYNPMSGIVQFNKNIVNNPLYSKKLEKLLKHELVHAKQYETVARSKDGIKKVNFAVMNGIKKNIEKSNYKEYFDSLYEDINNNGDKYINTRIKLAAGSAEVNLKDYIEAIHIMLNEPDVTYNDIPIVINSEHYQKVVDKEGPLTTEEEKKANDYYKAMLNYEGISFWGALNPWSSYRQNLLEKEAYKENPSLITKLSEL